MQAYSRRGQHVNKTDIRDMLAQHVSRHGRLPENAAIHSNLAHLAPVLTLQGIRVVYSNGVLASELWLGDDLPGVWYPEPWTYGKSWRSLRPTQDMPVSAISSHLAGPRKREQVAEVF